MMNILQKSILGHFSLTITNHVAEMARVTSWMEEVAAQFRLSAPMVFKLRLILEEVLPNIISYAFSDEENHMILINLNVRANDVELEIIDDGRPFNPLAYESLDESTSLETAIINGRGIHLIKSFTSEQEYCRIEQVNVFRVNILNPPEGDISSATALAY